MTCDMWKIGGKGVGGNIETNMDDSDLYAGFDEDGNRIAEPENSSHVTLQPTLKGGTAYFYNLTYLNIYLIHEMWHMIHEES